MRRALVALVLAALVAAGCSDDDLLPDAADRAPTTPGGATTDPPAATAPPTTRRLPTEGRAGEPGAGDPYYPTLGNGGYDVLRYELDLDVRGDDLVANATIEATATDDLDTFNLDFAGFAVDDVRVDGSPAAHRVEREELVVDPDPILVADEIFVVEVSYHGSPAPRPHPILGSIGWQRAGDVTIVVSEPYGAHYWFPSNDHPSDKAAFSFRITVPEGTTAVASGVLVSTSTADGRTTWEWHHPDPMPTYVAAVAIGPLELVESTGPHGVVIRHAFAQSLAAGATVAFEQTAGMIADLEAIFGPYPFDAYGALVVDASLGFALENQTLSLFDRSIVDGSLAASLTMVHELAHHWFGNWVSPATWQDIWLNEGFATYAEALWLEHTVPGYDIDAAMRELAAGPPLGPIGDPGSADLFTLPVYRRGALTLHALRRTMGDAGFFQLLRAWADRYGGESAGTEDFVALATEVAGSDMRPLLEAWLHAPEMPPLP